MKKGASRKRRALCLDAQGNPAARFAICIGKLKARCFVPMPGHTHRAKHVPEPTSMPAKSMKIRFSLSQALLLLLSLLVCGVLVAGALG
jgi:hypothetical protein